MTPAGFPHSGIHGSQPAFGYPWLFVDRYALLRLLVPRHPPCALSSLTIVFLNHARITFWVLYSLLIIVKKQKKASLGLLLLDTTSVVSLHFYFRFFIQFSRYTCGEQFAFPIHRKINHYARFCFAAVFSFAGDRFRAQRSYL